MSETPTDARFLKTKQKIIAGMITLLQHKSFDDVTVKDICDVSHVSRSAFYLHYEDKYDLVNQYQHELMKSGSLLIMFQNQLAQDDLFATLLQLLTNEGQLLALLIGKNGAADIQTQIKQTMTDAAKSFVIDHFKIPYSSASEKQYLAVALSNAIFGLIQEWVDAGQKASPEMLNQVVKNLFLS